MTVPIWFTLMSATLPASRAMASRMIAEFVHKYVVADKLDPLAEASCQSFPAIPVRLRQAVLQQPNREPVDDLGIAFYHVVARQLLPATRYLPSR